MGKAWEAICYGTLADTSSTNLSAVSARMDEMKIEFGQLRSALENELLRPDKSFRFWVWQCLLS